MFGDLRPASAQFTGWTVDPSLFTEPAEWALYRQMLEVEAALQTLDARYPTRHGVE